MGVPKNTKPDGCVTTTSNCVVWSGPNIPGIKLCTGDRVSDVVYKLATKLCDVLKTLNVNSYDVSCLVDTNCGPETFVDLFQLVLDTLCELKTGQSVNGTVVSPATDEIAIAGCLQSEGGDDVTDVKTYIAMIADQLCNQINLIQSQTNAITDLQERVISLEATLLT